MCCWSSTKSMRLNVFPPAGGILPLPLPVSAISKESFMDAKTLIQQKKSDHEIAIVATYLIEIVEGDSVLRIRAVSTRRPGKDSLSVRQGHCRRVHEIGTVFGKRAIQRHGLANLQRVSRPAAAQQHGPCGK